ncbi:metal-dependent hydrolase [Candidatus Woesearchaeota archaeon]|nr:metal-dependent hydrolase [Candidatus Woesearchaeota archaeon]
MAFVFVHLIIGWLFGRGYEVISGTDIGYYGWLFLLAGAVLPDIDLLADWIFGWCAHRKFTHSLLFAGLMIGLSYFILKIINYSNLLEIENQMMLAVILCVGISIHILTDTAYGIGVPLLWPSKWYVSLFKGINYAPVIGGLTGEMDYMKTIIKRIVFDMGLGALWFFYLLLTNKIVF